MTVLLMLTTSTGPHWSREQWADIVVSALNARSHRASARTHRRVADFTHNWDSAEKHTRLARAQEAEARYHERRLRIAADWILSTMEHGHS
jgi:hypothetical protein